MKIISDINASIKIHFNNLIKQRFMIVVIKLQNSMTFFIERLLLSDTCQKNAYVKSHKIYRNVHCVYRVYTSVTLHYHIFCTERERKSILPIIKC